MQALFMDAPRELSRRLRARLGKNLLAVVVYGSVARGEARWSGDVDRRSDIDVLVLVEREQSARDAIIDELADVDLARETVTNVIVRTPEQLKVQFRSEDGLARAILKEGVVIYGRQAFERVRSGLAEQGAAAA